MAQVGLDPEALLKQGLSSCAGCKEPNPCSPVPRAEVVFAELCFPLGAAAQLWDVLLFGKSFPTAQPLSRAFGSAAVEV